MSMILLREMVDAQFCGGYAPTQNSRSSIYHTLDLILMNSRSGITMPRFETEQGRIQLCNQNYIAFEDQPFAHEAMAGLAKRSAELGPEVEAHLKTVIIAGQTSVGFVLFRDTKTGAYVEPYYGRFLSDDYSPAYSIMAAYLMGDSGPIKVDVVPALTDGKIDLQYWSVNFQDMKEIEEKYAQKTRIPGPQCFGCTTVGCEFKIDFNNAFMKYLKAKQAFEQAKEMITQHLTYRGPSAVGYHTAYMKENVRRNVIEEKFGQWLTDLMENTNWKDFVKPDSIAVAKAIKEKKLNPLFGDIFTESKYYTIETQSNLGKK